MSRTYRTQYRSVCIICLKPKLIHDASKSSKDYCQHDYDIVDVDFHKPMNNCRDKKPWYKPPKSFKQIKRQQFRQQVKQALHNHIHKNKDFIPPLNKKSDIWEWT